MKWSESHIYTLKEDPTDAEIPSHRLMVRGGYIKKSAQGLHTYGPLATRSLRKLETIIREELDKVGCVEILLPFVQPKELWVETGRWGEMGKSLLKFVSRTNQEFCLGATHEEIITDYVRRDVQSYRDLPVTLYQINTKYRDEIRARFGLLRAREFIMKDAYSFDLTEEGAVKSYQKLHDAYVRIFERLGLDFRVVVADSGNIGGNRSQEFHILAESGEDELLVCPDSDFAANVEVCPAIDAELSEPSPAAEEPLEKFATPGMKKIKTLSEGLGIPERELVKSLFFNISENSFQPICVLLRGSDEVNPVKIKNLLGLANPPEMLTDEEVHKVCGAWPGSCGPVGLSIPVYMEQGVSLYKNYVVGANDDGFHYKGVNHGRDFQPEKVADLRMAVEGDRSPDGKGLLKVYRGIEAGHIFYLGTKYSKAMKAEYLDKEGQSQTIEMGCYGLGVSRTIQAAIEQCHDKDGIIWPVALAPYSVHLCLLDPENDDVSRVAHEIYEKLWSQGIDVLMDDRSERPGVKFKDADLLGMPVRVTVGGRGLQNGEIEVVDRQSKAVQKVSVESAPSSVIKLVESLKR
ncbi:MAG: proline--tRNA ligase [Bdellovibrionales bacterium]|nr:proline--tRNA ligase [Bdellovibrionales bacterium]